VSSSDECSHRRPGERTISTSEWNRREDAALAEQDYEDAKELLARTADAARLGSDYAQRSREYERSHTGACNALYRFRGGDKAAIAVDALEEHIGAIAELGTIARLRSKLANLPDGPIKQALATLLED
jgi:hypothetical protein